MLAFMFRINSMVFVFFSLGKKLNNHSQTESEGVVCHLLAFPLLVCTVFMLKVVKFHGEEGMFHIKRTARTKGFHAMLGTAVYGEVQ